MRKYLGMIGLFFGMSLNVAAVDTVTENDSAKIFFAANVNRLMVTNLINILDDINKTNNTRRIYLYIDSYGGDMDAGKMAYFAIKSSRIPVTTIAMVTVGSSATMMLCAAEDRRALTDASVFLHPSWIDPKYLLNTERARPDNIAFLNQESKRFNSMFFRIYQTCTNFSDDEINKLLSSESNRVTLTAQEAVKRKVISQIDDKIVNTASAFYISDTDSDAKNNE